MENNIIIEPLHQGGQTINVVTPEKEGSLDIEGLLSCLKERKEILEELLLKTGAILFRGFGIREKEDFLKIKLLFSGSSNFDYVDGNSPRTKLSADVYTSTEYPKEYRITLHNELSYSNKWPNNIFFFCKTPAQEGGETPIVDCRLILKELSPSIVAPFEQYGVKYTRYLTGSKGVGKTWMDTFETSDKKAVEEYCGQNGIEFFWDGDCIHLSQMGAGVAEHPVTHEKVWFNQANQFHPSNLPADIYEMLSMMHAKSRYKFPQYAFYGNGEEIPEKDLNRITDIQFDNALKFPWQMGDLLMLDNMLMAHGRMPFKGDRKVYVSMS